MAGIYKEVFLKMLSMNNKFKKNRNVSIVGSNGISLLFTMPSCGIKGAPWQETKN